MRCMHQSASEIRKCADSRALNVVKCNNDGSSSPVTTTSNAIEEMLEQWQSLWGLALPHFICVSNSITANCVSLEKAVAETEAFASGEDFLIVAYQDGGIISISGTLLPFQKTAELAEWWRPKY